MKSMYPRFALTLIASFLAMFLLTFSMIAEWSHFYLNLSNTYMALMMVSLMAIIMLAIMWPMYRNIRLNLILLVSFAAIFIASFSMGRAQVFLDDEAFMQSMIPHHSRAILVCEGSNLTDPEVIELCEQIVRAQKEEIAQMKSLLDR